MHSISASSFGLLVHYARPYEIHEEATLLNIDGSLPPLSTKILRHTPGVGAGVVTSGGSSMHPHHPSIIEETTISGKCG